MKFVILTNHRHRPSEFTVTCVQYSRCSVFRRSGVQTRQRRVNTVSNLPKEEEEEEEDGVKKNRRFSVLVYSSVLIFLLVTHKQTLVWSALTISVCVRMDIQGVSGGIVNILGGCIIDYSE
jgi:hypothetical protein